MREEFLFAELYEPLFPLNHLTISLFNCFSPPPLAAGCALLTYSPNPYSLILTLYPSPITGYCFSTPDFLTSSESLLDLSCCKC